MTRDLVLSYWLIFVVRTGAGLFVHETGPFKTDADCINAMTILEEALGDTFTKFTGACIQR